MTTRQQRARPSRGTAAAAWAAAAALLASAVAPVAGQMDGWDCYPDGGGALQADSTSTCEAVANVLRTKPGGSSIDCVRSGGVARRARFAAFPGRHAVVARRGGAGQLGLSVQARVCRARCLSICIGTKLRLEVLSRPGGWLSAPCPKGVVDRHCSAGGAPRARRVHTLVRSMASWLVRGC